MTTEKPGRLPALGTRIFVRVYSDIWAPGRINAVSSDGGIDIIDDEGATHSLSASQRGVEWRREGDPSNPLEERRAVVSLCVLSGLRDERARVTALVRAASAEGAWSISPRDLLAMIESGERAADAPPSSERAS